MECNPRAHLNVCTYSVSHKSPLLEVLTSLSAFAIITTQQVHNSTIKPHNRGYAALLKCELFYECLLQDLRLLRGLSYPSFGTKPKHWWLSKLVFATYNLFMLTQVTQAMGAICTI